MDAEMQPATAEQHAFLSSLLFVGMPNKELSKADPLTHTNDASWGKHPCVYRELAQPNC